MDNREPTGDRVEAIRRRAYDIWLDKGQRDGEDVEHWREAELEISGVAPAAASPAPKKKSTAKPSAKAAAPAQKRAS
jgi:hypothetical protein